jgi:uncharacterized protein (TIGR02246 family)
VSFFLLSVLSMSSSMFGLEESDSQAINRAIEHFTDVWNGHSGYGSADYYAEDADFVNIFGMFFSGKEEIESRHREIHKSFLKGSHFEVIRSWIREVKPDTVIAHVVWKVSKIKVNDPLKSTMNGIFTHVFIKNEDKWEITSTQNTMITD